ncbi:MAG: holo-ACP synthase [Verrucomicrobia bacterium]|nr:holo-ACP synthase [Verrucomicrobiota bacterium]
MILGTGIDLVELERIRSSLEKFGERFLKRILHPGEIAYCLTHQDPAPFVAGRFAAKEAISKAFGTGICGKLGWLDMEVGRKPSGEPFVILHEGGLKLLAERGGRKVHLSLSHTHHHATAVAILED